MTTKLDAITPKLRGADVDPGVVTKGPRAAVAAILRELPGADLELFFIRRAEYPGDPWSGHVAFPGGRRDPDDASLVATAIRETREEVGIDLSRARLLARLPDVPAITSAKGTGLVVTPFVFALREQVAIVPNAIEVAATLWVSLETLACGEGRATFEHDFHGQRLELPCIHLEPGNHRLWGMTYRMLETLLDAVR